MRVVKLCQCQLGSVQCSDALSCQAWLLSACVQLAVRMLPCGRLLAFGIVRVVLPFLLIVVLLVLL